MAVFNAAKREIDIKIVYYGPALCGKTTNVQSIHKKLSPEQRGDIVSLATKDDRTLFFDFLPIELGNVKGFKTRFHLYTVPGQVYYALTRRAVLTGVDGVVFVADSQLAKMQENIESFKDLTDNLAYYKKDLASIPLIVQYNKRDLFDISPVDELNAAINLYGAPFFEASALEGTGVLETLTACCKLVLRQLNQPGARKRSAQGAASDPLGAEDEAEPIIKITSEESSAAGEVTSDGGALDEQAPALEFDAGQSEEETPSLAFEEGAVSPEDGSAPTDDIPALEFDAGQPEEDMPSLKFDEDELSGDDGLKPGDDASALELGVDHSEGAVASQGLDLDRAAAVEDAPGSPSIGIQAEAGSGFSIIACGQPHQDSEVAITIPIIFKIEELNKECMLNLRITFDDFKLK